MELEHLDRAHAAQGSSDRSFGLVLAAVLAVLAAWPLLDGEPIHAWLAGASVLFAALALAAPASLAPLNHAWTFVGALAARVVSPIALGILFFLVVTPTGLLMRALGKNLLKLGRDANAPSYWIDRRPPGPEPRSFADPF